MRALAILLLILVLLGAGVWWWGGFDGSPGAESGPVAVASILGSMDSAGFTRVTGPRPLEFPRDHGPHPEQQIEWWYVTGNLEEAGDSHASDERRRFGFELTIFRIGLDPEPETAPRESRWATSQLFMAHFALTDVAGARFHCDERFARGALGLAGAEATPFRVWTREWSLESVESDFLPLRLQVDDDDVAIDLRLDSRKPLVLQGEAGYSRKGGDPGNASHYYSLTRLEVDGAVSVAGVRTAVTGSAWIDHEWSTSVLETGVVGWDWFALQLADGSELMIYQLRRDDGSPGLFSKGTIVRADGGSEPLALEDFELEVLAEWRSPETGVVYPARWRIAVPQEDLEVIVTPLLADQELDLSTRYWEGAVDVTGSRRGGPVRGRGYVELVGYGATTSR